MNDDNPIKWIIADLLSCVEALQKVDLEDTSVRELEYLQNYTYGATQALQELTDAQQEKEDNE